MGETTGRQFIISALIFSAVITGCFALIAPLIPSNNQEFVDYNRSLSKFNEINAQSQEISNKMETASPSSGLLGIINGLVETSWGTLQLMWNSVATMIGIVDEAGNILPMPGWFAALLGGMITVTVAFAIMAAIFKWYI